MDVACVYVRRWMAVWVGGWVCMLCRFAVGCPKPYVFGVRGGIAVLLPNLFVASMKSIHHYSHMTTNIHIPGGV